MAVRKSAGVAYLSWRLLSTDPSNIAFNIYRSANNGAAVKLNANPIAATTDFSDTTLNVAVSNRYYVRAILSGVEQAPSESVTLAAGTPVRQYLSVPLQIPPSATSPDGVVHNYTANDASVGDLDGDGAYEIVLKWEPEATASTTYNVGDYLDAYGLDGTRLFRIFTGRNIKTGAGYFQFIVYDLDGDGKAEIAFNSGEGVVSGTGQVIGNPNNYWADLSTGYVNAGPEYLTIFDGPTGGILTSVPLQPARGSVFDWGDDYGHRANGVKPTVAYLDGQRPSLVVGRGIYHGRDGYPGKTQIVAYDWRSGRLTQRWTFTATTNGPNPSYVGQGNHQVDVGDLDGDGRDEILWGAMAIDDDGAPLYTMRLGHGDAIHLSDMDPSRPGLEVFKVNESPSEYTRDVNGDGIADDNGGALFDAATGQVLLGIPGNGADVGRGVAMDIDPRPGYEMWHSASDSIYNVDGTIVAAKPSNMFQNFGVWWDADLYRELLDRTTISDWNHTTDGRVNFDLDPATSGSQGYAPGTSANNGTKYTPALSGDILGDWREEVIWRASDNSELRIFTTIIPATNRLVTLMHDVQYREAIAWQNVGYNQPPHPSFFLGNGMAAPPTPNVYLAGTNAFTGTAAGDSYLLRKSAAGAIEVLVNGSLARTFPATTPWFSFSLGGGNDTLTLDFSNGSPIPAGGLTFDAETLLVPYSGTTPLPTIRETLSTGLLKHTGATGLLSLGYQDTGTSIFAKLVYTGDANLDGRLDADDQTLLDLDRLLGRSVWTFGDFNYDGVVNQADQTLLNRTRLALTPPAPEVFAAAAGIAPAATPDLATSTTDQTNEPVTKRNPKKAKPAKSKTKGKVKAKVKATHARLAKLLATRPIRPT